MSTLYQAPALRTSHRYLAAVLLRLRRFVNRAVADMLAKREQAATQFLINKLGDRQSDNARCRSAPGVRAAMLVLIVAGSLSPAAAKAEYPVVRNHRGGQANQAQRTFCDPRNHTHTSDGGCVTARAEPKLRDHRTR
ncbi:hypothetical protein [Bradyrhizobium sp. WU425]|uniref:hypothetical protein n=1 Tax=Bradyrhizobium sp. WU425 TaxID=187029 RepID=UPI001E431BE4|nr:hypothetical protein [Bradyrhizobium canariense]UFW72687.1 hypothetical protein BcanWU425_02625 [Bradyrhizobium canariense]